ncbi:MAG: PKD domain-containing protein [Flavobacteriales bacterium]
MKKHLHLLCAAVLFSPALLAQQEATQLQGGQPSGLTRYGTATKQENNSVQRSMAQCNDKVTYVDNNGPGTAGDYVKVGGNLGWDAAMQSFPGFTGQITRIDFKGQSYTGTETIQASIHAIDGSNTPIGTPLGSVNVTVNTTMGEYGGNLPSPVNVTNGFAVVIWDLETGDSIKVMMNSDGDAQFTGYSNLFGGGTIYNVLNDYSIDADFLIRPTIRFNTRVITLSGSPTTVCPSQNVNFSYNYTSMPHYGSNLFNPNYTMLSLNYGDATPAGTSLPTSHAYASSGSYNAQLVETYDGWSSNCASDPSSQTITVNPGVNSFFNWSSNQLAVTFTNLCTGASTYSWLFGDAGTSAAPNPVHNYAASGTYTVELTATGTCGNDYYTTNITITDSTSGGNVGINQLQQELLVNLYPNPVNDVFTIQIESSLTDDIQVEVLSPVGQVISTKNIPHTNNTAVAFDMSAYASGVYFVRIAQGNSRMVKPFMKN